MKKLLGITLGIMTALGGFVDLGQIVFTTQAGALFGYELLCAIVLGMIAIIVYMEMCGRVAVVAQEPVFAVVRTRLGHKLGLATLIASNLLNLIWLSDFYWSKRGTDRSCVFQYPLRFRGETRRRT